MTSLIRRARKATWRHPFEDEERKLLQTQPGTSANLPLITRPVQQQQKATESALSSAV